MELYTLMTAPFGSARFTKEILQNSYTVRYHSSVILTTKDAAAGYFVG
jgi:hypothetical protein